MLVCVGDNAWLHLLSDVRAWLPFCLLYFMDAAMRIGYVIKLLDIQYVSVHVEAQTVVHRSAHTHTRPSTRVYRGTP